MALPSNCPLCKSSIEDQIVISSHVFGDNNKNKAFFKCKSCEVIYQFPTLSDEEENKFYVSEFEKFMESRSGTEGGWHNAKKHIEANFGFLSCKWFFPEHRAQTDARNRTHDGRSGRKASRPNLATPRRAALIDLVSA